MKLNVRLVVVLHTCDPGTQEAEAGGSLQIQSQYGLDNETLFKKKKNLTPGSRDLLL